MAEPYIKLFKRLLTWEWYKDTNTTRVFIHILLNVNYKPSRYKGEVVNAGECVFGRRAWAEELGLSEQNIRTALAHLQSTNEITIRATNRFSIIHVVKWSFWQIEDGLSTNGVTNKNSKSNQQLTTSKEYKNKEYINNNNNNRLSTRKSDNDNFYWRILDKLPDEPDEETLKILRGENL